MSAVNSIISPLIIQNGDSCIVSIFLHREAEFGHLSALYAYDTRGDSVSIAPGLHAVSGKTRSTDLVTYDTMPSVTL